jgi:hypothetical protein
MKDLGLVVISVVLTALLGRTWGHRRLLQQVQEQLAVLSFLPDEWGQQRRSLEELAARDMARYIQFRNPAFPTHQLMSRGMDTALVGVLIGLFSNMSFVPGPDAIKAWIGVAGSGLAAVGVAMSVIVLLRHRREVAEELNRAASTESQRKPHIEVREEPQRSDAAK